jgi:hypothetical protein
LLAAQGAAATCMHDVTREEAEAEGGGGGGAAAAGFACRVPISEDDAAAILRGAEGGEGVLARLRRARRRAADPSLRDCPRCGAEIPGGSAAAPALRCAACGARSCFVGGSALTDAALQAAALELCRAHDTAHAADDAAAAAEAQRLGATRCRCGTLVAREGGCNSMLCPGCGRSFCALCHRDIDKGELPTH